MEWKGQWKRNSLAGLIQATLGRLPTSNLTLSTKVASEADSLPPLPGLLGLVIIPAEGNTSDSRLSLL